MISRSVYFLTGTLALCILAAGIPCASAWSPGQPWSENPEHIAAMQAYVAYAGEQYKARMDGAIQYIGGLSSPSGTGTLQTDEQQFLATVATVPSMTTSDAIVQARGTMKTEISQFRTDLSSAFMAGNGTMSALRAAVNSSETADQAAIQNLNTAYWTASRTSRLDEFTYNDGHRTGVIANLTAKGIDASAAQSVETKIQALQPSLSAGFDAHSESQISTINTQLGTLVKQFWDQVGTLSWQERETSRLAAFDNTTTKLGNQLANLSAQGVDVSQAQGILSQITGLRASLKSAFDNHDQSALTGTDSQLKTLYQQYTTAVRGVRMQNEETARLAAFDNMTTKLGNELTTLQAKGVDVSQAQSVLSQIQAERTPLQAAYQNGDQAALTSINTQLKTLETQIQGIIKGYRPAGNATASRNAGQVI